MVHQPSLSLKSYLLRSQIYLNCAIVLMFTLAFTLIASLTFKEYSEQSLGMISHALADQLQAPLLFDDQRTAQKLLEQYQEQYHLASIVITDHAQRPLLASTSHQNNQLISLNTLQTWLISPDAGNARIQHNGVVLGYVSVTDSLQPVLDFLSSLFAVFIAGLLLGFLLIYINIRLIYLRIARGLDVLASTTAQLTRQRDFSQRVPLGQIREFNVISAHFNELLTELQGWQQHLEQENQSLTHRALHDPLTHLANREHFEQHVTALFAKQPVEPFALLYLDNDRFKHINDHYGHAIGDNVLCGMAERMRAAVNAEDFIARIGGDEFAIIVHRVEYAHQLLGRLQGLLACQHEPLQLKDQQLTFSFSIGVALSRQATDMAELIHQADQAMYQAKHDATKRFAFFYADRD